MQRSKCRLLGRQEWRPERDGVGIGAAPVLYNVGTHSVAGYRIDRSKESPVGNLPILIIFAALSIGYACQCAYSGHERDSKTYPINAAIAVMAILITTARYLVRLPVMVFLLGLVLCDVASFHFSYIGRKTDDNY
jgi:hypothetical protein